MTVVITPAVIGRTTTVQSIRCSEYGNATGGQISDDLFDIWRGEGLIQHLVDAHDERHGHHDQQDLLRIATLEDVLASENVEEEGNGQLREENDQGAENFEKVRHAA
eukprot:CAMPEP_0175914612 /NCGR_PEP_ID=MMETSP0108-20121206/9883_1 /TAXON_ID=195067 ORGANISM="Goniomonas pacifica, Strain CCMP1869" /NCGR_SAMPLE_ID=MMETSP0108 /ASSEMBLY_ACC=CAM_ASM_000204 /LENGTH=106 /DNA_ID=CAMNT_0017237063 /DNA_START=46 /DNA_END=365 /DNA_ORIENTATION=+